MGKVFVWLYLRLLYFITLKETIDYMMNAVWSRNAVLYEMNLRQTTSEGTLAAAAERLGFLRDLGIDAVWLMPHSSHWEGRSQGIAGFLLFDSGLPGRRSRTGDAGRFRRFCSEAHAWE